MMVNQRDLSSNMCKFKSLVHPHQFLETLAIACMGRSPFEVQNCLPSEKKSLSKRLEAKYLMEKMLIEHLADLRSDRAAIRALLRSNEKILRYLHTDDLYPTNELPQSNNLSLAYYQNIATPLLMIRLARHAARKKRGLLFHLHNMLQKLSDDYPINIQSYIRNSLIQFQKAYGVKYKPMSWVRGIRATTYPSVTTFKVSLDELIEKQPTINRQQNIAFGELKALYMAGLLFRTLKSMLGDFKDFGFYSAKMLALETHSCPFYACRSVIAEAVAHKDAALFLSDERKRKGNPTDATRALIEYNNYLFMPYVLQEQFKSDLTSGKRIVRLRNLFKKLGVEDYHLINNYFNKLDGVGYVLRALLSSMLLYEVNVEWFLPEFFESSLSLIKVEIQENELQPSTEREIIRALTIILSHISIQHHAGKSCNILALFLYCFRYNEEIVQPNSNVAAESLFWDTFGTPYKGQDSEYLLISAYNEFITRYAKPDNVKELLCNPLSRLEQSLKEYFESRHLGTKRAVNKAFRKDRTIVRLGSKYPYQAVTEMEQDILLLALSLHLSDIMPNIKAFYSLSDEEKRGILVELNSPDDPMIV